MAVGILSSEYEETPYVKPVDSLFHKKTKAWKYSFDLRKFNKMIFLVGMGHVNETDQREKLCHSV